DEKEAGQVSRGKEASDESRVSEADFPKEGVQAIGHETKRGNGLLVGEFGHVLPELLLALARAARGAFGFDNTKDGTGRVIKTVVGDPVPRCRIVACDWNFKANLG